MLDEITLKKFFTKSYGTDPPTKEEWEKFYSKDVKFIDPTQEKLGIEAYIQAQDGLIKRCDDLFLEPHAIAINKDVAFVEWTLGLKIKGIEFIYPGVTKLIINQEGLIKEHRDYFDFCSGTFGSVPILGGFFKWLYKQFVD